jgi:protoporphyrinogen oxidase
MSHLSHLRPVGNVIVLGGGLAGLVCAKSLATAGFDVEVWEAADRFGGKAGSVRTPGGDRWADHGYHVFMAWYRNTTALLDELGVELRESSDFHEVEPRAIRDEPCGRPIAFTPISRTMVATLDLLSRPDWYLDQMSVDGFIRARLYAGRQSGERLREIARKALGSPAYLTSALSMRRNLRWWVPVMPKPNWNALRGPMQLTFIEPLVEATRAAGAELHLKRRVARLVPRHGRLLPLAEGDVEPTGDADTIVVCALPAEVLDRLIDTDAELATALLDHKSRVSDVRYLQANPLAAVDLHLNRRVDGLPPGHFILRHSPYELTGLDITRLWPDYADPDHPTVLQVIAGDPTAILPLGERQLAERVVDDLARYFPITRADVDWGHTVAMKHVDEPLFANTVGSNGYRVAPDGTDVEGFYLAGDHTDTQVDLACMEGAIYSGLLAAEAVCVAEGHPAPPVLHPQGWPDPIIGLLKVLRYPLALAAWPLRLTDVNDWARALREWKVLAAPGQSGLPPRPGAPPA